METLAKSVPDSGGVRRWLPQAARLPGSLNRGKGNSFRFRVKGLGISSGACLLVFSSLERLFDLTARPQNAQTNRFRRLVKGSKYHIFSSVETADSGPLEVAPC